MTQAQYRPGGQEDHAGVGWAVAAWLRFGLAFWVLGFHVTGTLGGAPPVWIIRLTGATLILGQIATRRSQPVVPPGSVLRPLVASAILDTTGFLACTLCLAAGHVSVVTVLTSLFGAVVVLLSRVLLKERLQFRQWCGVVLTFVGVALVSSSANNWHPNALFQPNSKSKSVTRSTRLLSTALSPWEHS